MNPRTVSLIAYRQNPRQRSHFAIFIPSAADAARGTTIHVVGAPMIGYELEFRRNYVPAHDTLQPHTITVIGHIDSRNILDSTSTQECRDHTPTGNIEMVAAQIPPPRASRNFMAPVNDTTNRRCQEWTMEYVGRLVHEGYIGPKASEIVDSMRDPPTHGIGLQPLNGERAA